MFPERYEFPVLYKNLGHNKFKDVTAESGLKPVGWGGDASFADLNGDGWPDVYVLNMMGANHFFENHAGQIRPNKTSEVFPENIVGRDGSQVFRFRQRRTDGFVGHRYAHGYVVGCGGPERKEESATRMQPESFMMGPADSFVFGNSLYHNLGGGKFEEVSDRMGAENFWPWGPSIGDINADGWDDIFIASSMNFPFRYGINSMLLNNRGEEISGCGVSARD